MMPMDRVDWNRWMIHNVQMIHCSDILFILFVYYEYLQSAFEDFYSEALPDSVVT